MLTEGTQCLCRPLNDAGILLWNGPSAAGLTESNAANDEDDDDDDDDARANVQ
jgi:hypothetical protein